MDALQQERLGELFEQALALPAEDRAAFLDSTSRADSALGTELRSLLTSYREAPNFLEGLLEKIGPRALTELAREAADQAIDQVGARYQVLERLGGGGMGVVYKARDLRLGRLVALKLLPPHLTADDKARARLLSEAKATSVLDHPNIAVVHEIDETEAGRLFISMACYEGETLQEKLGRGALEIGDAVDTAIQIANALSAAHRAGIVHRDIKPSNVLITREGVVKLVDFGIAKAAGVELTGEGALLGTVAYMSPEQTRGDRTDQRTDLWSLGAIMYEMLTGVRPFRAESEAALIYAIRQDTPEPVQYLRPEVSPHLANIVETCLRKDPADRYDNAEALMDELEAARRTPALPRKAARQKRRVLLSGAAVAMLAIFGVLFYTRGPWAGRDAPPSTAVAAARAGRLAVLPLVGYGLDMEDAHMPDALTEEFITRLSKLSNLRVIARSSVMTYKETDKSAAEIGQELGVGAILEGSVRKSGDRVRITMQLVDPRSQEPLWAEGYDAEMRDVLAVQSEIVERVAEALDVQIQSGERGRLAKQGTDNPEAYALYMAGRYFLDKWDEPSTRKALASFEQALDLEPAYARAWGGLAVAYMKLAGLEVLSSNEAYARSRAAAERALNLDEELAEAHWAMALALSYYYWDPRGAEQHFSRAIDLEPSDAQAHAYYAEYLRSQGRFDEALREINAAQELDPLSPAHELEEGVILYLDRRNEEAVEQYRRLLDANPDYRYALFFLALARVQQERYNEALALLREQDPENPSARSLTGYIYAVTGRRAEALQVLASLNASLNDSSRETVVSPFHTAVIHVGLGEKDQAIDLLWEASRKRTWHMRLLKVEPVFDPLRSEPRFQALLDEVGLGERM